MSGVSYSEVSGMTGVPEETLMAWASKYKWPVPNRIQKLSEEIALAKRKENGSHRKVNAEIIMAESLEAVGERSALLVATKTAALLAKSFEGILKPPTDWEDTVRAVGIVQKVTGRDKPQGASVVLNLAGWKQPEFKPSTSLSMDSRLSSRPPAVDMGEATVTG